MPGRCDLCGTEEGLLIRLSSSMHAHLPPCWRPCRYPLVFASDAEKLQVCWPRSWRPAWDHSLPALAAGQAKGGVCPVVRREVSDTSAEAIYKAVLFNDKVRGWHARDLVPEDADNAMSRQRLQVILMPHTHVDPGWIKTVDGYYKDQTRGILTSIVNSLHEEK